MRLEWKHWRTNKGIGYTYLAGRTGHATVKAGRYLVTHNHLGFPLSDLQNGEFVTVSVFTAKGAPVRLYTRLNSITVTELNPETLLLDFGEDNGRGLFAAKGLSSAEFKTSESVPLRPGMEVAQIDWDRTQAFVDWVTINDVITKCNTPGVELANFVTPGASGGGVFWNGFHVANTWLEGTVYDRHSGVVLRQYSVAALNSPEVTAPTNMDAPVLP